MPEPNQDLAPIAYHQLLWLGVSSMNVLEALAGLTPMPTKGFPYESFGKASERSYIKFQRFLIANNPITGHDKLNCSSQPLTSTFPLFMSTLCGGLRPH